MDMKLFTYGNRSQPQSLSTNLPTTVHALPSEHDLKLIGLPDHNVGDKATTKIQKSQPHNNKMQVPNKIQFTKTLF